MDCGFLRLPTRPEFETIFLEQDKLLAILPEDHPLARLDRVPVAALCEEPFMLLESGKKGEISEIFERCGLTPHVQFTTLEDYAVMSMGKVSVRTGWVRTALSQPVSTRMQPCGCSIRKALTGSQIRRFALRKRPV